MEQEHSHGPLPVTNAPGYRPFTIVIYVLSASVSLLAFLYGLLIIYLDQNVWQNHFVRVIIVVQILNCFRFILRIVASFIPLHSDVGCRILLFLNNALVVLPANLCVYCVVYLQVLIVHKVSPYKLWPRIVFMTLTVLMSVFPPSAYTFISPRGAGLESYCLIPLAPSHRTYVDFILSSALWQYFTGVVGVISIVIIANYIWRARRASRRIAERSTYSHGLSRNIVQQYQSKALHNTLVTIIWYPITPIVSLWMNQILYSVSYYTRRTYIGLAFVNVVLLGLQSVLLAIGLVVYPAVQKAFKAKIWNRWIRPESETEAIATNASSEEYLGRRHLPLDHSGILQVEYTSSDSISDFETGRKSTREHSIL